MMVNDPVADLLTRIRNAHQARHASLKLPTSKMKVRVADILKQEGYIASSEVTTAGGKHGVLEIALKYDSDGSPVIEGLKRVSRPGIRIYRKSKDIPSVRGGMGMAILSTSSGLMTDTQARAKNVGGEVLCYIW